jgi:hypothetical protein
MIQKLKSFLKKIKLSEYIFIFGSLFVLASLIIFYLVDIRNISGSRDFLFNLRHEYFFFDYKPFFFQHWGRNSGFAEIVQWSLLGISAIVAAFSAGQIKEKNKKLFNFWIIIKPYNRKTNSPFY